MKWIALLLSVVMMSASAHEKSREVRRGLAVAGFGSEGGSAQDSLERQVMSRVKAAVAPAIQQFPETDDSGSVPKGNNTEALWMVRPPQDGERVIELIANPLNEVNQLKATRAMAAIERNIEAAQRKAAAQYERAVSEAKRTGRSQEVDGVTLSDEGVEGAKIDAESRVLIEVQFNQPSYTVNFSSGVQPHPSLPLRNATGATDVVVFPSNVYRDVETDIERYAEGETIVYLGRVSQPVMKKRGDSSVFEVTAATLPGTNAQLSSIVIRFRGNEALTAELVQKTAWNTLLELLR